MSYHFSLQPPGPTNFAHYLQRLQQTSERALYHITNDSFTRLLCSQGRLLWVSVRDEGTVDQPSWQITLPNGGSEDEATVRSTLSQLCCLDAPLPVIHGLMREDPALRPVVDDLHGVRMMIDANPWEAAAGAIISQQLNLSFAAQLKRRVMEQYGESLTVDGITLHAFPAPERVAKLQVEELRLLQFSQRKAEYLINLARVIAAGEISWADLVSQSDEAAVERLVTLRGVGRWTAECVLLFGLARPDLLPAADIGLRNAVTRLYRLDHQASEGEVRALAEDWHPWRSWVTYYLWLSLAQVK